MVNLPSTAQCSLLQNGNHQSALPKETDYQTLCMEKLFLQAGRSTERYLRKNRNAVRQGIGQIGHTRLQTIRQLSLSLYVPKPHSWGLVEMRSGGISSRGSGDPPPIAMRLLVQSWMLSFAKV
jgi:hypothetical protein